MIYDNLIINKNIFNNLVKFKKTKMPNAFIFHGNDGQGKEAHAIEFFGLLNCKSNNNFACGSCNSCLKTKKLQHEDLKIIFPLPKNKTINKHDSPLKALNIETIKSMEEMLIKKATNPYFKIKLKNANTILINSVREIKKNINLSVEKGKYKTYLIFEAEKLCHPNSESANSLLKILEEPPENVLFILITSDISLLLDTIISRCAPIFYPKLKNNKIKEYLDKYDPSNSHNNEIAEISNGSISNAIILLENYEKNMDILNSIINAIIEFKYDKIKNINTFLKDKHESIEILNLLNLFFRNVLLDKNEFKYLKKQTDFIISKYKDIDWEKCILLVNNTQNYILKNCNIEIAITSMIIELRKIMENKFYNANIIEEYLNYHN